MMVFIHMTIACGIDEVIDVVVDDYNNFLFIKIGLVYS